MLNNKLNTVLNQSKQFLSSKLMSIEKRSQVVNTNCEHFLINNPHGKDVHQIQPDKFTFLKSNLLISNILNKSSSKQKSFLQINSSNISNAYINCGIQIKKLEEQDDVKKARIERVRNLVKCRSQTNFAELARQEKIVNQKIQNVYILRKQMVEKAAEIMGKKDDNEYLGRNLSKCKQNVLKELKETNPTQKTQKTQTIRALMKQTAKKCNRKELRQLLEDSVNSSITKEMVSGSSFNTSMELSLLDVTNAKAVETKVYQDEVLRKLIKSKSTDTFIQQQTRRAVWNGFSQNWKKRGKNIQVGEKKLKKQPAKKQPKPKFQASDHEILNYDDHYSRFMALKRYENAFGETCSSYQVQIK